MVEVLQRGGGQPVRLTVARGAQRLPFTVQPYIDTIPGPDGKRQAVGRIGVMVATNFTSERLGLGGAIVEGGRATVRASTQVLRTVRGLFSGRVSGRSIGGPILIGQLAGESARLGLDTFLGFMAVLDGGQFLFLLAEAVIRRPLPVRLRERLTTVGLLLIILLMGLAFSNDFRRIFGG
jgi:regulator of sigma E protease